MKKIILSAKNGIIKTLLATLSGTGGCQTNAQGAGEGKRERGENETKKDRFYS
jgi:hypothetical protein